MLFIHFPLLSFTTYALVHFECIYLPFFCIVHQQDTSGVTHWECLPYLNTQNTYEVFFNLWKNETVIKLCFLKISSIFTVYIASYYLSICRIRWIAREGNSQLRRLWTGREPGKGLRLPAYDSKPHNKLTAAF